MIVGEIYKWTNKIIGTLRVEYRGKQWGESGLEACVIIREDGRNPEQLMVPMRELVNVNE